MARKSKPAKKQTSRNKPRAPRTSKKTKKTKKTAVVKSSKSGAKTQLKSPSKKRTAGKQRTAIASENSPKSATHSPKTAAKKSRALATRPTPPKNSRILRGSLPTRGESGNVTVTDFEPKGLRARSGGQSGDLQGLSDIESADSESVGELLEEGNAFEAEIVKGVQDAPDADEGEVKTHEVPEDDVPAEYFDEK